MKTIHKIWAIMFFLGFLLHAGCSKEKFLGAKPNTSIIIPTTLAELRSLLDYTRVFTFSPGLGELSADNYYLQYPDWQALSAVERSGYTWEADMYGNQRQVSDWSIPYQQVLYANIVLEQLDKNPPADKDNAEWEDIRGDALFSRAFAYASLVQHFAPAFDSATMTTDLGIPVRLGTDVHSNQPRASIKQCYDQIQKDLLESVGLLNPSVPAVAKNRPSRPAAYALLARTCLLTRQFDRAARYADSCLSLYNTLIDYNTISATAATPFDRSNRECIYYCQAVSDYSVLLTYSATVFADTLLYRSYDLNDLRRNIFFRVIGNGGIGFKRGYSGTVYPFTGLATDEVYLVRAEALARTGNYTAAMNDLNTLLSKRWKTGTYTPLAAISSADALAKILVERRKELPWRGLRWLDLKRWNKEGYGINLTRNLDGLTYSLQPGSPRYVFAIPDNEITVSGIAQNPR